jgi:hypothetical protein
LKILLSFLQDTTGTPHQVPSYRFWSYYIKNGITEAGMQWLEVPGADWAEGLMYLQDPDKLKYWKDKVWQLTLSYIKANRQHIDVFLCYLYPGQINTGALNEIKKEGIPCINFYCDHVRELEKVPREFRAFDLIWVPEYEALPMYQNAGVKYINLPMPMWVEPKYRQAIGSKEILEVSFIGSKDLYREQLLGEVLHKGLPLNIRGNGWLGTSDAESATPSSVYRKLMNQIRFIKDKSVKALIIKSIQKKQQLQLLPINEYAIKPIPDFEEYIAINQSSAVTLGINRVPSFKRTHTHPLVYSRLRDIEAPMLGACYLTEYCDGLDHLYDLGKEIYAYKSTDELVAKARELLLDKQKRDKLRDKGRHKALTELSIPNSLNMLQEAIYK